MRKLLSDKETEPHETPIIAKNGQKMPKMAKKCKKIKNPKTGYTKIDSYIFPMMSIIISDSKEHAENTGKQPDLVRLSENHQKNAKNAIS